MHVVDLEGQQGSRHDGLAGGRDRRALTGGHDGIGHGDGRLGGSRNQGLKMADRIRGKAPAADCRGVPDRGKRARDGWKERQES